LLASLGISILISITFGTVILKALLVMKKLRRDSIAEDDYTILDLGWDNRLEGKRKSDNPYPINNWKHYEWVKGWEMADKSSDSEKV
jgi:hypothetical protein